MVIANNINYTEVSVNIPLVMNAMFNDQAFNVVTLKEIRDAFRLKQIQGKAWMLDQLKTLDRSLNIFVAGSWLGFTSLCLYKQGFKNITECDIDARLKNFTMHLNRQNPGFKHIVDDINNIDLSVYDLIINTSCEHIANNKWFENLKSNQMVCLQSTDLTGDDHLNLCHNIHDMINKYPLTTMKYADTLDLTTYHRYMLVGYI